jgi:flavin reductase (DIM6/NTAB) family NADH-FMN oxidoreductase RutF
VSKEIKDALRMMPYGFYSITSRNENDENAMVANWISQASFDPQLIIFALQKTSYSYGFISEAKVFAVNIFLEEDSEAIKPLTKSRNKNPDKMKDVNFTHSPIVGCPVLDRAAAYLECEVDKIIDIGGDHDVVVAKVVGAGVNKPADAEEVLSLPDLGWSYAG